MTAEEDIKRAMDAERDQALKYALFPGVGDVQIEPAEILDFTKPYTPPPFVLDINGTACLPLGSVGVVTGQAGHGKTMLLSMMSAAVLGGEYENMRYVLADGEECGRVIYIDTEQAEPDTIAVKNRVMAMCRWPLYENNDAYCVVRLRSVDAAEDREHKIFRAIMDYRPTLAIIDGALDLTADFNDLVSSQALVFRLMKLAEVCQVCLIIVNHQNPFTSASTGEKLAGHLGSALQRKANDIFQVAKEIDKATGAVSYRVSDLKSRGRAPLQDWHFFMRHYEGEIWVPVPAFSASTSATGHGDRFRPEDIAAWLKAQMAATTWPATTREVWALFARAGVEDEAGQKECLMKAKNLRYLLQQTREEMPPGQRSPRLRLNPIHFPPAPSPLPPPSAIDEATPAGLPFAPPGGEKAPF